MLTKGEQIVREWEAGNPIDTADAANLAEMIDAALSERDERQWLPIETVPKTGEEILLGHGNSVWVDSWADWLGLKADGGRWIKCPANEVPTHWMPLPEPPIRRNDTEVDDE